MSAEIKAIAYAVHKIRPSWPTSDIERVMTEDHRDFAEVALAAITAARSKDTRFPGGIRTTYAGSEGCQKCAERQQSAERNSQPPAITRCQTCGRVTDLEHSCRSSRPEWWPSAQQITAQYSAAIRAARTVGDHETANRLAQRQQIELREVMANV